MSHFRRCVATSSGSSWWLELGSPLTRPSFPFISPDDVAGTGKPTRLQFTGELRHDVEATGFGGS